MMDGISFMFYDRAGERYGLTPARVARLVKEHNLKSTKIWGSRAVDWQAWEELMATLGLRDITATASPPAPEHPE